MINFKGVQLTCQHLQIFFYALLFLVFLFFCSLMRTLYNPCAAADHHWSVLLHSSTSKVFDHCNLLLDLKIGWLLHWPVDNMMKIIQNLLSHQRHQVSWRNGELFDARKGLKQSDFVLLLLLIVESFDEVVASLQMIMTMGIFSIRVADNKTKWRVVAIEEKKQFGSCCTEMMIRILIEVVSLVVLLLLQMIYYISIINW